MIFNHKDVAFFLFFYSRRNSFKFVNFEFSLKTKNNNYYFIKNSKSGQQIAENRAMVFIQSTKNRVYISKKDYTKRRQLIL